MKEAEDRKELICILKEFTQKLLEITEESYIVIEISDSEDGRLSLTIVLEILDRYDELDKIIDLLEAEGFSYDATIANNSKLRILFIELIDDYCNKIKKR